MTKHHLRRKLLRALARERLRQRLRTGLYAPPLQVCRSLGWRPLSTSGRR